MSEDTDLELDDFQEEEVERTNPGREHQRKLERELKESKAANKAKDSELAAGAAAIRQFALRDAGIDISAGACKLFAKSYDGELTVEAIKAQAEEYGLVPTSQTAEIKEELVAFDRVSAASVGSSGFVPPTAESEIRSAKTPEDVIRLAQKFGVPISNEQPGAFYSIA